MSERMHDEDPSRRERDEPPPPAATEPAATADSADDVLAALADDFGARLRRGERATAEEYAAKHPELAERIRKAFPAIAMIEETRTADSAAPGERVGSTIGRYKLLERIGEGGFGVVYMAEQHHPVRRRVALKVVKPGMDSRQVLARFEAERQALAIMDHPNIAKVHDAGATDSGRPYFVMELVKGEPITDFCDANKLPPRQRLELFAQVCHAVQHAHQKGVIHRDLKPSNVLVASYDGKPVPKVIDFGVAKATGGRLTEATLFTGFGALVGTPEYMSPEQAELNQLDVDTRSDIYALGVILYELLTGSTPLDRGRFKAAALAELLRVVREEEPPKPSTRLSTTDQLPSIAASRGLEPKKLSGLVRGELDWIVMKALEKDRNRRYETANAFAADVQRYLADEPVQACPPSTGYRLKKCARRNKVRLTLVGMAAALLAVLGWTLVDWGARRAATHQVAIQALAEADDWQERRQYPEALAAARRAEALAVGSTASGELRERARRRRADLELVLRLDEIHLEPAAAVKDDHFDFSIADQRYDAEFHAAGLAVDELTPEAVAERIRATTVAVELAAALDYWARARRATRGTEDAGWLRLLEAARRADPHEWRCRLRDALAARDPKALEDLAKAPDVAGLPAASLGILGNTLRNLSRPDQAVELLRAAQRRYPDDFWINHHLGFVLCDLTPAQLEEAIRFYTVAVALRPQSPGTRLNFGTALRKRGRLEEAVAAYREAIRLKPDYASAHYALGQALSDQVKLAEAEAAFKEAIRLKPDFAVAHDNLGAALADQGKLAEAEAHYREAIRLNPDSAFAHYNLGIALDQQGKPAEAEYHEAIRLKPDFPEAHDSLGKLLRHQGKLAEAETEYREAIRLKPDFAEAHVNLGFLWHGQGKLAEAETKYREAVRHKPGLVQAHHNLGEVLVRQKRLDEGIAEYREAIRLDPENAGAYSDLGSALLTKDQPDEAVAACQQAIRLKLEDAWTYNTLGRALEAKGDLDAAINAYTESVRRLPKHARLHVCFGTALTKQKQWDRAIAEYREAIRLEPKNAEFHVCLGLALCQKGLFDEAIAEFGEAIRVEPDHAGAWYFRGNAHKDLMQYDKAIANYSKAIELLQQHDKALADWSKETELKPDHAGAWHNRGTAYSVLKQYDKALADLTKAIELQPGRADSWSNRGNAYRALKQYDKALADHSQAIDTEPGYVAAWNNRGAVYQELKRYDQAIADYSKAVELNPDCNEAWYNRGKVHHALTQYDKAIADYRKALELVRSHAGKCNNVAWLLATCPEERFRDPKQAVELAKRAVDLEPNNQLYRNTLGVAQYRAGDFQAAVEALNKSIELRKGGDSFDWFFLAMAHWRLDKKEEARRWYDKAVASMEKDSPQNEELRLFRAEAAALLKIEAKPNPK